MILSTHYHKAIHGYGIGKRPELTVIDVESKTIEKIIVEGPSYIWLKALTQEHFISVESFEGNEKLNLNIRPFSSPESVLTGVSVTADSLVFSGDDSIWKNAPRYYVRYLSHPVHGDDYRLIDLQRKTEGEVFPSLEWFDDSYDKCWQGPTDVVEVPGSGYILFSIGRSSSLVLYDPEKKAVVRKIGLAGRAGDGCCSFNKSKSHLWCVDYDTLLKFRTSDFKKLKSRKLQDSTFGLEMKFIGEFSLSSDEKYCAVARPYNRDVILIDSETFKTISKARTGSQPYYLGLLPNYEFVCICFAGESQVVEFGQFDFKKRFFDFLWK